MLGKNLSYLTTSDKFLTAIQEQYNKNKNYTNLLLTGYECKPVKILYIISTFGELYVIRGQLWTGTQREMHESKSQAT